MMRRLYQSKFMLGIAGLVAIIGGTAFTEATNFSDQKAQLQSLNDLAALSAGAQWTRNASVQELDEIARAALTASDPNRDYGFRSRKNDTYTVALTAAYKPKILGANILFPNMISTSAEVSRRGGSDADKTLDEIQAFVEQEMAGTHVILAHTVSNFYEISFSADVSDSPLSQLILEIYDGAYNATVPRRKDFYQGSDILIVATDKEIDAASCKLLETKRAPVIIHPYGRNAEAVANSCENNMLYCCGHAVIRDNFSLNQTELVKNLSRLATAYRHLHVSC